jgi:hypothetical protein
MTVMEEKGVIWLERSSTDRLDCKLNHSNKRRLIKRSSISSTDKYYDNLPFDACTIAIE